MTTRTPKSFAQPRTSSVSYSSSTTSTDAPVLTMVAAWICAGAVRDKGIQTPPRHQIAQAEETIAGPGAVSVATRGPTYSARSPWWQMSPH